MSITPAHLRSSLGLMALALLGIVASLAATKTLRAQNAPTDDSTRFATATWQTDSLDGYTLRTCQFAPQTLFNSAQHLFLVELPPQSARRLAFTCDSTPQPVDTFALRADAPVAINGSFFDMDNGLPVCYLRIEGHQWGENTPARTDSVHRKYYQHALITLADGRPHLAVPDSSRRWEESLPDSNIMTAGPMLLRQGQVVPQRDDRTFVTHRHNRTALGLRPDGTVLLLVADGRFEQHAAGLTLPELAQIMQWLGCTDAINLDGGGSTTLYMRDKGGILNYPSDNNRHDHEGLRPVSNAILLL